MYDRRVAGLSPKSLDNYNYFLLPFLSFCGADTDVQAVSNAQIGAYIESCMKGGGCGLLKQDVNFDSNILKVCGKGNKERVFVGRRGQNLTCDAVKHMISKLAAKLPFEFSSHKLRHNFATNYCLDQYEKYGQVDIYRLMILMGHENINTTRRYLHFANQLIAVKTNSSHIDGILLKDGTADVV